MMLSISGKLKTDKRYKALDYANGLFVTNVIHATLWSNEHEEYVKKLIEYMNKENDLYEFKLVKRG